MDKSILTDNDKYNLYDKALNELCKMYNSGLFEKGFYLAFHNSTSHLTDPHTEIPGFFPSSDHKNNKNIIQFLKKVHGKDSNKTEYEIAVLGDIIRYSKNDFGVYGFIKINETRENEDDEKTTCYQPFLWTSTHDENKAHVYGSFDRDTLTSIKNTILSKRKNIQDGLESKL